jgi:hypothetical protein
MLLLLYTWISFDARRIARVAIDEISYLLSFDIPDDVHSVITNPIDIRFPRY